MEDLGTRGGWAALANLGLNPLLLVNQTFHFTSITYRLIGKRMSPWKVGKTSSCELDMTARKGREESGIKDDIERALVSLLMKCY